MCVGASLLGSLQLLPCPGQPLAQHIPHLQSPILPGAVPSDLGVGMSHRLLTRTVDSSQWEGIVGELPPMI